jgi:Rieske 2Fe-2S family protein
VDRRPVASRGALNPPNALAAVNIGVATTQLQDTMRPLAQARTLPRAVYTDAAILDLEQRALFGRRWLAIAREEDLPEPGSFVTHEIGAERVLVVRGADDRLRAFFNVCRHRGARIVEEAAGRLRGGAIACPYHAWAYALDGSFLRAPRIEDMGGTGDLGLVAMPLATRDGFVFVNLDREAPAFERSMADLPDLRVWRLAQLRRVHRIEYEVAANWKIVCENYSECYHCPLVHPQLNRISDLSSGGFESGPSFNGGPMRLRVGYTTMSTTGRSPWPRIDGAAVHEAGLVAYYLVHPNLMLGLHPDYLLTHTAWPLGTDRTRVVCEWFFPPGTIAQAGFDPSGAVEFWDLTNRQDWALCGRVQSGAHSRGYSPGPYHPSERCVHAYDAWYAQWLAGELQATA